MREGGGGMIRAYSRFASWATEPGHAWRPFALLSANTVAMSAGVGALALAIRLVCPMFGVE